MRKKRDLFSLLWFPGFSVQKISVPRRRTQHWQPGQIAHTAFDGNTIAVDLRADPFLILILGDADHSTQRPRLVGPFGVGYQYHVSLLQFDPPFLTFTGDVQLVEEFLLKSIPGDFDRLVHVLFQLGQPHRELLSQDWCHSRDSLPSSEEVTRSKSGVIIGIGAGDG